MNRPSGAPNGNLLLTIRGLLPSLNEQEQKVGYYILDHPEQVVNLSITDLAEACGASDTTIFRFCRQVGTEGYRDFKIALARTLAIPQTLTYAEITPQDTLSAMAKKVISVGIKALQDTLSILDIKALEAALDAILEADKVDIYGAAGSGIAASELQYRLTQLGIKSNAYPDTQMQVMSAALLTRGDVAIGISHSGRLRETVKALETAKAAGATTICITNHPGSPITEVADIKLYIAAEETTPVGDPLSARAAQLAIVDTLYEGLILHGYEEAHKNLARIAEVVLQSRL